MSEERNIRRSDQIRARRTERAKQTAAAPDWRTGPRPASPARRPAKRVYQAGSAFPPVMVRGGAAAISSAAKERKTPKARRRYDVPLSAAGAEMRLPSMPRIAVGWRVISFLLVCALGYGLYTVWNSPKFQIETVEIGGLQRIKSQDVKDTLALEGERVFFLDPKQIAGDLKAAYPEFSQAQVQVEFPATVAITVTERVPVLTWIQNGQAVPVDKDGVALEQRQDTASPSLVVEASSLPPGYQPPSLSEELQKAASKEAKGSKSAQPPQPAGPEPGSQFLQPEMVTAVESLSKQIPGGVHLLYDGVHGFGWQDPQGWKVYFGDDQDIGMKLTVYQAILAKLQSQEVAPVLVSVEHVHAPYFRTEQ